MRKRFTKIICAAVAAISAFGLVFTSACGNYKWKEVTDKDTTAQSVTSNGGFLVQTGDYVYFINGVAANTDSNQFGTVVKGSIQRIKKSDLQAGNYRDTQTIVPSVIYSGQYNAGIYIYGDYIYYTTPSTQKDGDGNLLNSRLDFKRSALDGSETMKDYIWQSLDNSVDYRYVQADGTVYILYAIAENLYGTSTTNIHSVNCETGANTLIAYNVSDYAFDTQDPENPCVYYTMDVPQFIGVSTDTYGYNQLYRARADVTQSPREYDFSAVEGYDASSDPLYINYGDYVFDGIGTTQNQTEGRLTQFNYANWSGKEYALSNSEYTYAIKSYKNGDLYFTRISSTGSTTGIQYVLSDGVIDADNDGSVDASWDAVDANKTLTPLLYGTDTTDYRFVTLGGKTYAISAGSDGITKGELIDGVVENKYVLTSDASATILDIRKETTALGENTYLYYSMTGGNGYTFYRIAIDGESDDYTKLSSEHEWDTTWTYRGVRILDLDACSGWYAPEFVGNTLVFASETRGMTAFNYIMACDLSANGVMMTNAQLNAYNEKYEGVTEKIEAYDEETNADGSAAYANLSNALKYLYYTADKDYLDDLIGAYVDILGKDKEYLYSERSAEIYREFAGAEGDWADYAEDYKTVNGATVYANSADYYYSLIGQMTEEDAQALKDAFKSDYMQSYPVDTSTWWEKLNVVSKVFFIIGMCVVGLLVLGGIAIGVVLIVKRFKKRGTEKSGKEKMEVDITDDKSVDVYGDDNAENAVEEDKESS